MNIKSYFTQPIFAGIIWGFIGGVVLIVTTNLTTNGPLQNLPSVLFLIVAILTTAFVDKSKITLFKFFITGLLTFLIMNMILYFYIGIFINPNSGIPMKAELFLIGVMIAIGIVSSLLISLIVKRLT